MALRRIYNGELATVTQKLLVDGTGLNEFAAKIVTNGSGGSNGGLWIVQTDGGQAALDLDVSSYAPALHVAQTGTATKTALLTEGVLSLSGLVGQFVANGTTPVVVNSPYVTASTRAFFSFKTLGGTRGAVPNVSARVAGTSISFVAEAGDTSTYDYLLIG